MSKYKFKRTDRASVEIPTGQEFCYTFSGCNYGCANDDSRLTGVEHDAMTLDPSGNGHFFTIPKEDLEIQP